MERTHPQTIQNATNRELAELIKELETHQDALIRCLNPFALVCVLDSIEDERIATVTAQFTKKEAHNFNNLIEANGLPIKKADLERGFDFPNHTLSLDGIRCGHFRDAAKLITSITGNKPSRVHKDVYKTDLSC